MALTDFGTLSAAQKRVWAAELWQAGRDASFFFANGFIGGSTARPTLSSSASTS
jgi:hypothetical protein